MTDDAAAWLTAAPAGQAGNVISAAPASAAENIPGDLANPCPVSSLPSMSPAAASAAHQGLKDQNHYPERSWYVPQRQQRASAAWTPAALAAGIPRRLPHSRAQPRLPLPPLRASPHRGRTHRLARPGRPDRDADAGWECSVNQPSMTGLSSRRCQSSRSASSVRAGPSGVSAETPHAIAPNVSAETPASSADLIRAVSGSSAAPGCSAKTGRTRTAARAA